MESWQALLEAPRTDFPRGPAPKTLPSRPWMALLLLAACLVPRLVAAWNWHDLWGDSLHYRYASLCLEKGDFEQGFAEFGLNVYPLILIPLAALGNRLADQPESTSACSWPRLTVVPLWGWLRRMFDDRLAVIACLFTPCTEN